MVRSIVFNFAVPVSVEHVLSCPSNHVQCAWDGEPLPICFSWRLARDPDSLWMAIEVPASPTTGGRYRNGEFAEGLANGDVAEVFLMDSSGRYQEWHVNADGAWWAMIFNGYRSRDPKSARPNGVLVQVMPARQSWTGVLRVPRTEVGVPLNPDTLVHVSGIAYSDSHTRYFSSAGSLRFEPDFHDERCFATANFVSK